MRLCFHIQIIGFFCKHIFFLLYNNLLFVTLSEILEIMSFKIAVLGLGSKDNTFYEARYHTVDHFTAHILAVAKI